MKVLPPIVVTDGMVISSSVFETAPDIYDAGTTYALGDYRAVLDTLGKILIYKSLQASNTGHTPASSPTWWGYDSSTYAIYNNYTYYSKDHRVIDPVTHKVYQSIVALNFVRPLDSVNYPAWALIGPLTYAEPLLVVAGTAYVVGDVRRDVLVSPYGGVDYYQYEFYRCNTNNTPASTYLRFNSSWTRADDVPRPAVAGRTYSAGTVVIASTGIGYQALINGATPVAFDNVPAWVEVGMSNKFAPFDPQSSTQAIANKSITYTVATGLIEAVALVNCLGDFATVTVRDGLAGPIVYENTNGIAGDTVSDWYQYLFSDPTIQRKQVLFTDIPPYANSHVTITVTSAGTVAIGDALFGRWKDVGLTNFGLQAGITDFSVVTEDGFGGTKFVKRGNKKYMDSRNWIKNEDFNRAFNLLSQLPATPCFWLAGDVPDFSEALGLKAYYKDFSVDIAGPQEAYCTLKLIGLI